MRHDRQNLLRRRRGRGHVAFLVLPVGLNRPHCRHSAPHVRPPRSRPNTETPRTYYDNFIVHQWPECWT